MQYRKKLFSHKILYDTADTEQMFLAAVRENIQYHRERCQPYRELLERQAFDLSCLKAPSDIERIPALPTLYLKAHELFSIPYEKTVFRAASSGTAGNATRMGMDLQSCLMAWQMIKRTFSYYHLFSLKPVNYVVLGYEPSRDNKTGAVKTAYGATLAAPARHREYALKRSKASGGYKQNLEGVVEALQRYEKQGAPVRFMGFPSYFYFLLELLQDQGISLKFHPDSKVFLAGGWKQFFTQKTDKQELYRLAEELLGISSENCKDFYGAVEHPVLYCDCANHHFHVPVYSRIIIRDPFTLEPVPYGTPGIVNLVTPLMGSMPFVSVLTDDLAVMYEAKSCGCGIQSPWFELLGRAGMDIKTCAAGAAELLKEVKL